MSKSASTTKRITVTIPDYLEERLREFVPEGKVSAFVSQAIEERIDKVAYKVKQTPLERMWKVADSLPKFSAEEIQKAIDEGRP